MRPELFFTGEQKRRILAALREAELTTSGEIRLYIENRCKADVLDRAAAVFSLLKMHKTRLRNGVLFYLALHDRAFAILGDAGINAVTPDDFWDGIRESMQEHFREGRFAEGLEEGIYRAGLALKEKFPRQRDDVNELPDEIRFGKEEKT